MWYFLNSRVPEGVYSLLGKVSTNVKKNADRLKKINQKGYMVNQLMSHFTLNDWIFDSPLNAYMLSQISVEEKLNFNIDISTIKWKHYTYLFCYGMQTYVIKQKEVPVPQADFDDVIAKRPSQTYFNDIFWAYNKGKVDKARKQKEVIQMIITSPNIQKAMADYISNPAFKSKHITYSEAEQIKLVEGKVFEY